MKSRRRPVAKPVQPLGLDEVVGESRLRELRERWGLTRAQLAEAAGVRPSTIRAIEDGDRLPSLTLALVLSRVLRVDVEDLFDPITS